MRLFHNGGTGVSPVQTERAKGPFHRLQIGCEIVSMRGKAGTEAVLIQSNTRPAAHSRGRVFRSTNVPGNPTYQAT